VPETTGAAGATMAVTGSRPATSPSGAAASDVVGPTELALDTVGAILRILGEYALDLEEAAAATVTSAAEGWARHVLVGTPPPQRGGAPAVPAMVPGRRDWAGVRDFVRDYARGSSAHARTVLGDLRQVIWVFIQTLNHNFAQDQDADGRVREQLARLAELAQRAPSSTLKRETLSTVMSVTQLVDERRRRHAQQMEALGDRVRSLGHELEAARREGEVDALTRLFNRKAFDEYLDRTVELHRAFGHEACLLFIDVDHFKQVNDGHGHTTGDALLCKIADAVSRVFPRKNDFVARYGGDELAVVLRETQSSEALGLCERLLRAVRGAVIERERGRVGTTISVGVAPLLDGDDGRAWIDRADRAVYRAKQDGRDRFVIEPK
jgi:diguanylate cyclase (GGDEF)-like protein